MSNLQKYKVITSKGQKRYTLVLSASSQEEIREKLHKEGYSILQVETINDSDIEGKRFYFQAEKEGEIKNWIVIWDDIFKIYKKLRDQFEYHVLSLYPEGDSAENDAIKKQKIISELEKWYEFQKIDTKQKELSEIQSPENSFYLQKQLLKAYTIIDEVIEKIDILFKKKDIYFIDDDTHKKLQDIYERLIHVKTSSNLVKLKEIGELALIKIAKIQLEWLQKEKNKYAQELLKETNTLLKRIGSKEQFLEPEKDFKKNFLIYVSSLKEKFSFLNPKEILKKKEKKILDTESYDFLKTVLLLEKYKEKLKQNSQDIFSHPLLFINIFSKNEEKQKILLKRKVIEQNIAILKAKKSWSMSSYTGIKKWYRKVIEQIQDLLTYLQKIILLWICFYSIFFFFSLSSEVYGWTDISFSGKFLALFIIFFSAYFLFELGKNIFFFFTNIVFFTFLYIFIQVNF